MSQSAHAEVISNPPAITLINEQPRTLSTDVAAYFDKGHKDVMRQIRNLLNNCDEEWGRRNFAPTSYTDEQGRPQPCYSMTKDGFTLLAMGFTGPKAMQFKITYIEAFNAMEAELAAKGRETFRLTAENAKLGCPSKNLRKRIIYQLERRGGLARTRDFYNNLHGLNAESAKMILLEMQKDGLVGYRHPGMWFSIKPSQRPLPAFDPAILAKCDSTHPQDRALAYAGHKYHDLLTAKIKDEDALAKLTGNYTFEPNAPEVIEAYHLLVKFEDMARAFPDALRGMMMMERELAQCRLQLAKVKQAIIDSPAFG